MPQLFLASPKSTSTAGCNTLSGEKTLFSAQKFQLGRGPFSRFWVGRMQVLRSFLVVLVTFLLSVSFAAPRNDLAYDESELLPYGMTPPLSADLVLKSALPPQVVPSARCNPRSLVSLLRIPQLLSVLTALASPIRQSRPSRRGTLRRSPETCSSP